MKECSICNISKTDNEFYRTKTGFENQCKDCRNEAHYKARIKKRIEQGLPILAIGAKENKRLKKQGLHYCPRCELIKPLIEFSTTKVRGGIASHCKACCREINDERNLREDVKQAKRIRYKNEKRKRRDQTLRRKFGITIEQYELMSQQQNNKCAICGKVEKKKSLAVDHDHSSGKVRGLLCGRCNPAIGFLLDDIELAEKAAEYIKKWS